MVPFDAFDPYYREEHFMDHGYEFGAETIDEYEAMADHFMTKPLEATMKECLREPYRQILCRYDRITQEYGSMYVWGTLITYFKPDPAIHHYP